MVIFHCPGPSGLHYKPNLNLHLPPQALRHLPHFTHLDYISYLTHLLLTPHLPPQALRLLPHLTHLDLFSYDVRRFVMDDTLMLLSQVLVWMVLVWSIDSITVLVWRAL